MSACTALAGTNIDVFQRKAASALFHRHETHWRARLANCVSARALTTGSQPFGSVELMPGKREGKSNRSALPARFTNSPAGAAFDPVGDIPTPTTKIAASTALTTFPRTSLAPPRPRRQPSSRIVREISADMFDAPAFDRRTLAGGASSEIQIKHLGEIPEVKGDRYCACLTSGHGQIGHFLHLTVALRMRERHPLRRRRPLLVFSADCFSTNLHERSKARTSSEPPRKYRSTRYLSMCVETAHKIGPERAKRSHMRVWRRP